MAWQPRDDSPPAEVGLNYHLGPTPEASREDSEWPITGIDDFRRKNWIFSILCFISLSSLSPPPPSPMGRRCHGSSLHPGFMSTVLGLVGVWSAHLVPTIRVKEGSIPHSIGDPGTIHCTPHHCSRRKIFNHACYVQPSPPSSCFISFLDRNQ